MSQMNVRSVLAPPYFPAEGRLPKNIDLVQANIDLQTREEKEFKLTLNAQNGLNNTPPCCKSLHVSLFFDGTNNNEKQALRQKDRTPVILPDFIMRRLKISIADIIATIYPVWGLLFRKLASWILAMRG